MEPNKIMIINEATWVASGTTTLGPGEGKVWKVKLKESALDGFSGTIRILDANGATQNYSIPGTSAASDVNSHANEEVWMMSGDTIVRWSEVAYVEIYEYTALDQRFFGVSSVDYTANYKAYNAIGPASAFFGQPFEILTLPIDYEGGHTDSGYTSTYYACPTEMYLAYVDKQGVEHPVVDTMGSNGYMNFATSTYPTVLLLKANGVVIKNLVQIVWFDFPDDYSWGYCVDSTGTPDFNSDGKNSCVADGGTWEDTGTNTWYMRYNANLTTNLPEIREFTVTVPAADTSPTTIKEKFIADVGKKGYKKSKKLNRHLKGVLL